MCSEKQQHNCLICETAPHDGLHFNVLACRACSAFFRRNTVSGRQYQCKASGKCRVEKGVFKFCKACRYTKCIQVGMNKQMVQLWRDKLGPRSADQQVESPSNKAKSENASFEHDEPTSSLSNQSGVFVDAEKKLLKRRVSEPTNLLNKFSALQFMPSKTEPQASILDQMRQGYLNYMRSQRDLYFMLYSKSVKNEVNGECREVRYSEYVQMRRACLSPLYVVLNEHFWPFNELDSDSKKSVLRPFADQFSILDHAFRTLRNFSDSNDSRIFLHHGQCIDQNRLSCFFDETNNPDTKTRILNVALSRLRDLISKMKIIEIRVEEIGALAGIVLWNEVSFVSQMEMPAEIQRKIYTELHRDIESTYGKRDVGQRMGLLLCMLQDLDACSRPLNEIFTLTKIFNPDLIESWTD